MTEHKIIDNALELNLFKKISDMMFNTNFPWFYADSIAYKSKKEEHFYFTHTFYKHQQPWSEHYNTLVPLLDSELLGVKSMVRIKGNLYPRTNELEHHGSHVDMPYEHKGAILYINDNNGKTILEDGTEIESKANRLLLFDPSKPHNSTNCTDAKCRININMNYF